MLSQGMAMLLIAGLNMVLEGGPKIWEMMQRKKASGEKVILADIKDLEGLWEKPGEEYFTR